MTLNDLEHAFTRYAVPYSRMTPDGKKIDAEGTARKLLDKKASNKPVGSLRVWLGQRADKRYVCWHQQEQKVVLISEYLMPCLNDPNLARSGSVDVTECAGLEYVLGPISARASTSECVARATLMQATQLGGQGTGDLCSTPLRGR